jgi:integrase
MKPTSSMVSLAQDYLHCRRKLGVELLREGSLLLKFAQFADRTGHAGPLTQDLAESWACISRTSQINRARRLAIVRRFAHYRRQFDFATQVPHSTLLGRTSRRLTPHVYSTQEIEQLLAAAGELTSTNGLRGATYEAFFGLIAATGLRLSEAINLKRCDVDLANGILTVRRSKYAKTRIVPLHPSCRSVGRRQTDHVYAFVQVLMMAPRVETRGSRALRKDHHKARDGNAEQRYDVPPGHVRLP